MICKSCGAEYDDKEPKCPFCGTMNEKGAKRQFFKKLLGITDTIEDMAKEPKKVLVQKTAVALLIVTVVVVLGVMGTFAVRHALQRANSASEEKEEKELMKEIEWQNEVYPQLDEWYAQQNYDAIVDYRYQLLNEDCDYSFYDWRHYTFIGIYEHYTKVIEYIDECKLNEPDADDKGYALFHAMTLIYDYSDEKLANYIPKDIENSNWGLTQEEITLIKGYRTEAQDMITNILNVSKEEQDKLYEDCEDASIIRDCYDYFK